MTVFVIVVLFLLTLFFFMIMPSRKFKKELSKYDGTLIAHRGLYNNEEGIPENSLAAFSLAAKNGYAIEFDIRLTKDGEVVVFHDSTLKRMCGADKRVYELTLEELREYNLLSTDEKIPTLSEMLETVGESTLLFVEVKADDYSPYEIFKRAKTVLDKFEGEYAVQSFDPRILRCYKKHQPEIIRGQLAMGVYNKGFLYGALACLLCNFISRPHYVAYVYENRKNVFFKLNKILGAYSQGWTVRTPEELEEAKKHYDIIIFENFRPL